MIEINIDPVAFLSVRWYGIMIALAILVLILWTSWQVKKGANVSYDTIFTAAMVGIPSGIIISRLLHVIDGWEYYRENLGQIMHSQKCRLPQLLLLRCLNISRKCRQL